MVAAMRRRVGPGLLAVLLGALTFATAGPFAKALITAGWSPGLVVLFRMSGAAVALAPFTLTALRGRWGLLRTEWPLAVGYGLLAVACAQLGYFGAIARLPVGVALLIEYLGIVLVVLYAWATTRRRPHHLTFVGVALALVGLVLVLDVAGQQVPDVVGVLWALFAAVGMAGHYVLAAKETTLPPIALGGLGLFVGSVGLAVAGAVRLVPMTSGTGAVEVAGRTVPAWVPLAALMLVAGALAYSLAIIGARRLGSTLSSFVGLTEVLFAIAVAWLVLGELPRPVQLVGGAVLLSGVVAVRLGERDRGDADQQDGAAEVPERVLTS